MDCGAYKQYFIRPLVRRAAGGMGQAKKDTPSSILHQIINGNDRRIKEQDRGLFLHPLPMVEHNNKGSQP